MRELRPQGSVRGALSNERSYRDKDWFQWLHGPIIPEFRRRAPRSNAVQNARWRVPEKAILFRYTLLLPVKCFEFGLRASYH